MNGNLHIICKHSFHFPIPNEMKWFSCISYIFLQSDELEKLNAFVSLDQKPNFRL